MVPPLISGKALIDEINACFPEKPRLWWLGGCGFVVKFRDIVFYIDPRLPGFAALDPSLIDHAGLVLATRDHPRHLDPATLLPLLAASPQAKLVLPKAAAESAVAAGIPLERLTTTASGLRVEYFKGFDYARIYAVPSPPDGLGYLLRFGGVTIYYSGTCALYDGLLEHLRPYNVNVALLAVGKGSFSIAEACHLAKDLRASWIAPVIDDSLSVSSADFVGHVLGHGPGLRFKIFELGEGWQIPEDSQ